MLYCKFNGAIEWGERQSKQRAKECFFRFFSFFGTNFPRKIGDDQSVKKRWANKISHSVLFLFEQKKGL
jgi:hypothetical protein